MYHEPTKHMTAGRFARLTRKQRDVLELLVEYKTSKEISRILSISPHTVDQRIDSVRRMLGGVGRRELIQAFLDDERICQQLTYEESPMVPSHDSVEQLSTEGQQVPQPLLAPLRIEQASKESEDRGYRVLPELFEGKSGTLFRIAAIAIIAVLVSLMMLAIMSIYLQLSGFLRN